MQRWEEDGLLELEVRGESGAEAFERMASIGASAALESAGDFPSQRVEVAMLLRGLLSEAPDPVSQADLDGRHAVGIPEARARADALASTVPQQRAAASAGPRGMTNG